MTPVDRVREILESLTYSFDGRERMRKEVLPLLEQQVPRWVSVKEHEPEFKARLWVTDGKTVWDDWFGYEWIREGDAFKTVEGTVIAWQPYFTPLPPEVKP